MDAIEAMARSMCERRIRDVRRWDTDADKLEAMLPQCIDLHWRDHVDDATAALRALADNLPDSAVEAGAVAWLESTPDQLGEHETMRIALSAALRSMVP